MVHAPGYAGVQRLVRVEHRWHRPALSTYRAFALCIIDASSRDHCSALVFAVRILSLQSYQCELHALLRMYGSAGDNRTHLHESFSSYI